MIYFSLLKHVRLLGEKKTGGPLGPANKSYPEPHELLVIHASSTIESGAPRIDCLAMFFVFCVCFVLCRERRRRDGSRHRLITKRAKTDEISVLYLLSSYLR